MSRRHAALFALLSLAFATIGMSIEVVWLRLPPFWFSASFALLAAAYAGVGPRMLGKRSDGTRPLWLWIPFGPYFATSWVSYWLLLAYGGQATAQATPTVFFGRRLTTSEAGWARWAGVLDLAPEFPEAGPLRRAPNYLSIPVLDATAPTPEQLRTAVDFLDRVAPVGPVYVHCAAGHGRSATIVAAWLSSQGAAVSVDEGEFLLQTLRPGVRFTAAQRAALEAHFADAKRR